MSIPMWPYLLSVSALILGGLIGWWLRGRHQHGSDRPLSNAQVARQRALISERRQSLLNKEAELAQIEDRLNRLNRSIANAQDQLEAQEREHARLLMLLEEKRSTLEEAEATLQATRQALQENRRASEGLLSDIDRSLDELDTLSHMKESYSARINRLAQQIQLQDSKLRLLRQTIRERSQEIGEAEALLEQHEAELTRLNRQRRQIETDIAQARRFLTQRTEQFAHLLRGQDHSASALAPEGIVNSARLDVAPSEPQRLAAWASEVSDNGSAVDDDEEDDLTQIPSLAELYAVQLKAGGIKSFRQLAQARVEEIDAMLDIPGHYSPNIRGWIEAAREIVTRRRRAINPK